MTYWSVQVLVALGLYCTLVAAEVSKIKEKYTTRYDNVNLDQILENRRLYQPYVKCLLNEAPCTHDGYELKSMYNLSPNFTKHPTPSSNLK